jgi:hypothetical protein
MHREKALRLGPASSCGQRKRGENKASSVELSSRLWHLPLGVMRLNAELKILEFRPDNNNSELPDAFRDKQLFTVAPWAKHPYFVDTLRSAIQAGTSNLHFDFTVPAKTLERRIHINMFALGDMTAWLFISDPSVPQL